MRTDSAVETGSAVTGDYDPMIAKVIAHGADRAEALSRLDAALGDTVVLGVDTNIAFLRALLAEPAVRAGDLDTGIIDRLPPFTDPAPTPAALEAAAMLAARHPVSHHFDASPLWLARTGWRLGGTPHRAQALLVDDAGDLHAVVLPGEGVTSGRIDDHEAATSDTFDAATDAEGAIWVHADGATHRLVPLSRRQAMERRLAALGRDEAAAAPELRSPMPGAVVAVHVAPGARVATGDRIVTIEAMKMEHPVIAPHGGVVRVDVAVGDQVRRDQILAHVVADATPDTLHDDPPTPAGVDPS